MAVESWDVQLEVMVARSRGKRYMCGGVWGRGIVGLQGDGSKAIEEGFDLGMWVCVCVCVGMWVYVCVCRCLCACVWLCMCMWVCLYVCVCVSIWVCVCVVVCVCVGVWQWFEMYLIFNMQCFF